MTAQVQIRGGLSVVYRVRHVCCPSLVIVMSHFAVVLSLVFVTLWESRGPGVEWTSPKGVDSRTNKIVIQNRAQLGPARSREPCAADGLISLAIRAPWA